MDCFEGFGVTPHSIAFRMDQGFASVSTSTELRRFSGAAGSAFAEAGMGVAAVSTQRIRELEQIVGSRRQELEDQFRAHWAVAG